MSNLVPACHLCNRQKGDKTPAELYIGWDLRHRWSGKGAAQKSDTSGLSLRDMYMSIHEEVLGLLDDLDKVAAEIADPETSGLVPLGLALDVPLVVRPSL